MFLDANTQLHHAGDGIIECPHCCAHAHMTPTATPEFSSLQRTRPATTGMVFHCDNCATPVFMRLRIKRIDSNRIDFHLLPQPVEKSDERFGFNYLPAKVETLFRDALGCYRNNLFQPFAAMIRLTAQAIFADLDEGGKLRIFDQVGEIADLANIDENILCRVRSIIFDADSDSLYFPDGIDRGTAAIVLETMKDVLHQSYIRHGRLRKALQMRQFFAGEARDSTKITSLKSHKRPTGTG
jgi:hypothetical protein